MSMCINSPQILTAIEFGELAAKPVTDGMGSALKILVADCEVARIGSLHLDRPGAKVTPDGRSVEVFPSHGLPDGFMIPCETHEDAVVIAEALDKCFEIAHLQLMEERDES